MTRTIALAGSPTALGGHFGGMERTPAALRAHGLQAALEARPALADVSWRDAGDAANDPGWAPDDDPWAKNRARIVDYLPRLASHVSGALGAGTGSSALLLLGGDCTSHAGAMAGIRRARPGIRLGIAWFDAHGDFNTPDTTPSGNVWGMPFAMLCGRGPADLLAACDAPSVREADAALLGAQVLDETESRMLAASPVATFGAGMLADPAGQAALAAWAATVAGRIDAWYVAFDLDALDAAGGWAVAMPETDGLSLEVALAAVRTIAATGPVAGFGATAALIDETDPVAATRTVDAVARLAEAALA
ncbi:MAG TPA: arginase family protein [Candidatus Saccharimonadales bacterium]|nr:arginase family protein [Candidatus Saccharimonadales bacterium]